MDLTEEKSDLANNKKAIVPFRISRLIQCSSIPFFYMVLGPGVYLLWVKSLPIFLTYAIILIVSILIYRYPICRSCFYYWKPCPSFGFSYIAKIFPKADDRQFNGKAAGREIYITMTCLHLPILALILSWFWVIDSYSFPEYILTGIYVVIFLSAYTVHEKTGCKRCQIEDCPFSLAAKISKVYRHKEDHLTIVPLIQISM